MKLAIDATNLLGDSVYTLRPLYEAREKIACLVVGSGYAGELFNFFKQWFPVVHSTTEAASTLSQSNEQVTWLRLDADSAARICFSQPRIRHLSEGYAEMLGVKIPTIVPITDWMNFQTKGEPHVAIAPFSRSCARHSGQAATKTLEDWKWRFPIAYLKKLGFPLKVYGSDTERLSFVKVREDEYCAPTTLADFEGSIRACKLLVTVDNGLAHLASCFNVPTIVLWPSVLPLEFIAPGWSATTKFILLQDAMDNVIPAAIMFGIREMTKELMYGIPPKKGPISKPSNVGGKASLSAHSEARHSQVSEEKKVGRQGVPQSDGQV